MSSWTTGIFNLLQRLYTLRWEYSKASSVKSKRTEQKVGAQEKNLRETKSVGFAWRARQRWFFRAAGTPCASTASMIGQSSQPWGHLFNPQDQRYGGLDTISCKKCDLLKGEIICIFRNVRSQSCPYCRGSLKRVSSMDLWVLTGSNDVVDSETLAMDSLIRFHLYIESLATLTHDTHVLLFDYMIWDNSEDRLHSQLVHRLHLCTIKNIASVKSLHVLIYWKGSAEGSAFNSVFLNLSSWGNHHTKNQIFFSLTWFGKFRASCLLVISTGSEVCIYDLFIRADINRCTLILNKNLWLAFLALNPIPLITCLLNLLILPFSRR